MMQKNKKTDKDLVLVPLSVSAVKAAENGDTEAPATFQLLSLRHDQDTRLWPFSGRQ